jgi:hypothetical protein
MCRYVVVSNGKRMLVREGETSVEGEKQKGRKEERERKGKYVEVCRAMTQVHALV